MRGTHRIIVQNKRIRYDFEVRRNITIIRGDSATGKTALVDMVREYFENGDASGVELVCDKSCCVLDGRVWRGQLSIAQDSIVFVDEGNNFVASDEFAAEIQNTDNYYVIVTREGIPSLPYSVEEVYGIRNSGKYGTLKRTYNELYHLYSKTDYRQIVKPKKIITEDSNAGFQFFQGVCEQSDSVICISAQGKSNIFTVVASNLNENVLVIADGASFGCEIGKLMLLMERYPNIVLYLPESFEWMILKSGVVKHKDIEEILRRPDEQIESRDYFSWERYFTEKLVQSTRNTFLKYTKKHLNPVYLQKKIRDQVLSVMENIDLGER